MSNPLSWRRRHGLAVPALLTAVLLALAAGMGALEPLFHALFPAQERAMYRQETFLTLLGAHVGLVLVSSGAAAGVALGLGVWVTRAAGRDYRSLVESLVAMGQTFPPVAVLALAVPLIGFGERPAYVALALYGLLPMLQGVIAGLESTPASVRDAAQGLGLSAWQIFWQVELPLAAPLILAGMRSSVTINIGTAAIASTVGAPNLGSPIIVGLSGFNTAYILQGALLTGLLAITVDTAFERLSRQLQGWKQGRIA
jgi:osmoprotectant transport system permease protein